MYASTEITSVHLEITSRCNASCPQCPRNVNGGRTNPTLPLTELSIDDVRTIFPVDFIQQLRHVYMCGNYGDAVVARDTLDIFNYFRSVNPRLLLKLHTNGSGRTSNWWASLAQTISVCTFSIDGLEDTNHIYRRGTVWPRIMNAVEAFVGAGGHAEWEFLVFKHNEHQIHAARELSNRLGFRKFTVKKSERFVRSGRVISRHPVLDEVGKIEYYIEPPNDPHLWNAALSDLDNHVAQIESYSTYIQQTPIECKVARAKKIYVSAEGLVFPCCWTANLYSPSSLPGEGEIWRMIALLPEGKASLDARKHPLRSIIDGRFFQYHVPSGWAPGPLNSRLAVCARTCGSFDANSAQYGSVRYSS